MSEDEIDINYTRDKAVALQFESTPTHPEPSWAEESYKKAKEAEERVMTSRKEKVGDDIDESKGLRFNLGKNRMELIPPEWMWALADVTTQGSKKYDARNWEKGMPWSTMIGCTDRHKTKFLMGERYDGPGFDLDQGTTGCHHLAMAAWNCLALMSYDLRGLGTNDLPQLSIELLQKVNAGEI